MIYSTKDFSYSTIFLFLFIFSPGIFLLFWVMFVSWIGYYSISLYLNPLEESVDFNLSLEAKMGSSPQYLMNSLLLF